MAELFPSSSPRSGDHTSPEGAAEGSPLRQHYGLFEAFAISQSALEYTRESSRIKPRRSDGWMSEG